MTTGEVTVKFDYFANLRISLYEFKPKVKVGRLIYTCTFI